MAEKIIVMSSPRGNVVRNCNGCKPHPFQDSTYGRGNRVCNLTNTGSRCTVCSNEVKRDSK